MRGIVKDILAVYPALKGLELDLENLSFQCQTRGLSVFTLDLPTLDAMLLSGLETGSLQLSGPFSRRVSKRVKVPRLFSGLWLLVFDKEASLKPDADVNAIFFLRCLTALGKKITVECSSDRVKATRDNYHDIERRLRRPTGRWDDDCLDPHSLLASCHLGDALEENWGPESLFYDSASVFSKEDEDLLNKVQRVADLIVDTWPRFDPLLLSGELERDGLGIGFKHGLGAVAERLKNWEKSQFPNWSAKLDKTFPWGLCGVTAGSDQVRPPLHEPCSRLMCVPKTAKSPRLIASEPTSHMWCQQALLEWFKTQFKTSFSGDFIDLKAQWKSGALVIYASVDRSLATVDLSDASDRVTCWTVERIFRKNQTLLTALHAARTRYIRDKITDVQDFLKLRKFASQGTATTFPVMSFVMLCVALGSCISGEVTWQKIRRFRSRVRVFGDDIIIPTYGYARLLRTMELLQLKANVAKSYHAGYFRESCGVDGYKGYDITPVRPQRIVADSPASCRAVVDTANNLFYKGLWNASNSLKDTLPRVLQDSIRIVGPRDAGIFGHASYCGTVESHLRRRWNHRYQRYEVAVWDVKPKTTKVDRTGYAALLDFFASRSDPTKPRIVSVYTATRGSKGRPCWEPTCVDAL
jgi:hypothetical protein